MAKKILIRLVFSALLSFGVSAIYIFARNGDRLYEGNGFNSLFLLTLYTFLCAINFILSLTALFNLKETIRKNYSLSMISFVAIPFIEFLVLMVLFILKRSADENLLDFFDVGIVPLSFCLILLYHFHRFRKVVDVPTPKTDLN